MLATLSSSSVAVAPPLRQHYDAYTAADRWVWQRLFERQLTTLPQVASADFMAGLARVGFEPDAIPDFRAVNPRLRAATGWELVVVPGIVDDAVFFGMLAARQFPATTWLRTPAHLDYLEEPDMFHDVFAHVPLLTDPFFADFLQQLGTLALAHLQDSTAVEKLARLYWFTVEFGLIREAGQLRIYGAGILSSHGETQYCLGPEPTRHPFDLATVLQTAFAKDRMQDTYFVIDAYEQLPACIPALRAAL